MHIRNMTTTITVPITKRIGLLADASPITTAINEVIITVINVVIRFFIDTKSF